MTVHCTSCGEELLGSVNRCWRCGTEIEARSERSADTTDRDTPVDSGAEDPGALNGSRSDELAHASGRDHHHEMGSASSFASVSGSRTEQPIRRGSPFADCFNPFDKSLGATGLRIPKNQQGVRAAQYPRHASAVGGAVGALVLGVFSLVSLFFSAGGPLLTAMIGIGLGVWGLKSDRRNMAIIGLVLCIIVFLIAGFLCMMAVYNWMFPRELFDDPFDPDPFDETSAELGYLPTVNVPATFRGSPTVAGTLTAGIFHSD